MNVGIYSFETLEVQKINMIDSQVKKRFKDVEKVYVYSENTLKQEISQRVGLRKMLKDYKNKKISIIVLENMKALGTEFYLQSMILKKLMKNNNKFYILDIGVDSTSKDGIEFINTLISIGE